MTGIVAPEIGSKSFGAFDRQAPALYYSEWAWFLTLQVTYFTTSINQEENERLSEHCLICLSFEADEYFFKPK